MRDCWRNGIVYLQSSKELTSGKTECLKKISDLVIVTVEYENGERRTKTAHTTDGKWKTDSILNHKVIAWQPLPEEYHE